MITHVFRSEIGNPDALFAGCLSLATYEARLKELGETSQVSRFCQHGFEALVEAIVRYNRMIYDFATLPSSDADLMIHGIGKDNVGLVTTCSVFVENPTQPLTSGANKITTFFANSMEKYGIETGMYLFSNAEKNHENTSNLFIVGKTKEKLKVFLRADIEKLIEKNVEFWYFFAQEIKIQKIVKPKQELRDFQKEASDICMKETIGQVITPTGTGKTQIEAEITLRMIEQYKTPIVMICSPRIMLTYQLIGVIAKHLSDRKVDASYLNLSSGQIDEDGLKEMLSVAGFESRDIPSTTSAYVLYEHYQKAKELGLPFIIGATYDSACRVLDCGNGREIPITALICDEAHNLVMGKYSDEEKRRFHQDLKPIYRYHFTATQAITPSVDGSGMNNEKLFGKVIYTRSPKQMIEKGEIVAPYIHRVSITECLIKENKHVISVNLEDIEDNYEAAATVVIGSFKRHKEVVENSSIDKDKIGAKLLVICKGQPSFAGILKSNTMREFSQNNPAFAICGISTETGSFFLNQGEVETIKNYKHKSIFMKRLQAMIDDKDAIIFHIDMIGEGIDVPGITGVMPFRELGTIKSNQTLGRAMRLCPTDRTALYSGQIKPLEFGKMVKPYAWIVLPVYTWEGQDMYARVVEIGRNIKENLGYMPFQVMEDSKMVGGVKPLQPTYPEEEINLLDFGPETMTIIHMIEEPMFLATATNVIGEALKNENLQRIIKDAITKVEVKKERIVL